MKWFEPLHFQRETLLAKHILGWCICSQQCVIWLVASRTSYSFDSCLSRRIDFTHVIDNPLTYLSAESKLMASALQICLWTWDNGILRSEERVTDRSILIKTALLSCDVSMSLLLKACPKWAKFAVDSVTLSLFWETQQEPEDGIPIIKFYRKVAQPLFLVESVSFPYYQAILCLFSRI